MPSMSSASTWRRTSPARTTRSPPAAPARRPPRTSMRASERTGCAGCWSATTRSPSRSPWPQVPEFAVVLVVVNAQVYGGSGGSVGVFSLAPGATEIALHEMGHTAFGLADEYAYYAGGVEPGSGPPPSARPLGTQRHDQHRPSDAQVELGGRRGDGVTDDEQSGLRVGGRPSEPGTDGYRRPVRGRALLPLRCLPARVRLQDASARACPSAGFASTSSPLASRRQSWPPCRLAPSIRRRRSPPSPARWRSRAGRSTTAASPRSASIAHQSRANQRTRAAWCLSARRRESPAPGRTSWPRSRCIRAFRAPAGDS